MPRVTEEYRAARRQEILAAAGELFARNGFHATSMADIISASGMSAGAVYRYFRSKDELIGAVAENVLQNADGAFARLLEREATPAPVEALRTILEGVLDGVLRNNELGIDLTRIVLQVWAEAGRNSELGQRVDDAYRRLRGHHAEVARRWQAAGNLPADADPEQVGAAMLGLAQGFLIQNLLVSDTSRLGYVAGVEALLGGADRGTPKAVTAAKDAPA
ncbi:TetR/AcrR family transcriptional regulator [Kineosporia babensis]|uniref:TetR/AcrR family transcriptional regulator n=1 Tax=Kineosporia babensis TaxID=499548 RepID=A0A9X1STB9_9ACTN|nr:TetR/AcrR family transcriptional regulator [Kineosporia babensis]MCD5310465.1 TetR/AcrR family transcriptional regulator [Kineosporia babensis]